MREMPQSVHNPRGAAGGRLGVVMPFCTIRAAALLVGAQRNAAGMAGASQSGRIAAKATIWR
jgi:hypothetical protein